MLTKKEQIYKIFRLAYLLFLPYIYSSVLDGCFAVPVGVMSGG